MLFIITDDFFSTQSVKEIPYTIPAILIFTAVARGGTELGWVYSDCTQIQIPHSCFKNLWKCQCTVLCHYIQILAEMKNLGKYAPEYITYTKYHICTVQCTPFILYTVSNQIPYQINHMYNLRPDRTYLCADHYMFSRITGLHVVRPYLPSVCLNYVSLNCETNKSR